MVPQSIPPSDKGRKLPWNSWDPPASRDSQWVEESARPRAFRRNKTPSGWRNPSAHGPPGVPKPPAGGGIIPPAVLPASENLQWAEETPVCGNKKRGSRSVTLDGNPDVECGGVLLSHTLSSAVPSPRPGLSFRVRKGTGRLTWAMTTAKPIQRPTPTGRPAEPEPCHTTDSDRGGPGTGQRTRTKRFTGIVSVTTRNNAPCHPTKETTTGRDPTQQAGRKECAAFAR